MIILRFFFLYAFYLGKTLGAPPLSNSSLTSKIHHLRSQRSSNPLHKIEPNSLSLFSLTDTQKKSYSLNWAGAVIEPPSPSSTYTFVSATMTVPTPTPTDNTTYQAASIWVGIDGVTHTAAILQTGLDVYVIDGEPYADAWYEWYPNTALYYDEFAVSPGDVIIASVNMTAPNSGICMIENQSTGETVSKAVSAPRSTATLAGMSAEWIVEDFDSGGERVPFVNFDRARFEGCEAFADGAGYGLEGAVAYELVRDEVVVAGVDVVDGRETVVTRFGE